ncbi:NUDIX domain-containing protein [Amnibacterium kyonggiense]|uniref:luciferase domain-containing protein n=1 Tax=Amnibacterium kyonggiense TaxID=595671 RepID=UPI0013C323DF|nr:NUDIX domain-containing protein [Amnibacterium kyonggiense]
MLWPVSAKAVIVRDGAVLLGRNDRGEWELPGGRVEAEEEPADAVVREVAEETGLRVAVTAPLGVRLLEVLPGRSVLIAAYACAIAEDRELVVSSEHEALQWHAIADLEGLPLPQVYRDLVALRAAPGVDPAGRRPGARPTTSTEGPHRQLDQRASPALWGRLVAAVFALPDVEEGRSQVSPISSRAVFLTDREVERSPETSLAPGRRLEPVHLHGVDDTSVHLCLPAERGRALVDLGWAEPHQYEDFGTEFMVYGPRTDAELGVVLAIVRESIEFARGA